MKSLKKLNGLKSEKGANAMSWNRWDERTPEERDQARFRLCMIFFAIYAPIALLLCLIVKALHHYGYLPLR